MSLGSVGGQYYFTERETEVPKELSDLQNVKHNFRGLLLKLRQIFSSRYSQAKLILIYFEE